MNINLEKVQYEYAAKQLEDGYNQCFNTAVEVLDGLDSGDRKEFLLTMQEFNLRHIRLLEDYILRLNEYGRSKK